jgi:hypothetical protein
MEKEQINWDYYGWRNYAYFETSQTQIDWNQTLQTLINQTSNGRGEIKSILISNKFIDVIKTLAFFEGCENNEEDVIGYLNKNIIVYKRNTPWAVNTLTININNQTCDSIDILINCNSFNEIKSPGFYSAKNNFGDYIVIIGGETPFLTFEYYWDNKRNEKANPDIFGNKNSFFWKKLEF